MHRATGLAVLLLVALYLIHSCTAEPPAPTTKSLRVAALDQNPHTRADAASAMPFALG